MWIRLGVGSTLATVAVFGGIAASQAALCGPPAGLTPYGHVVWNFDALLHDTFGSVRVWRTYVGEIPNFSAKPGRSSIPVPYVYTFATARHSAFRAVRAHHPPRIGNYATGSNAPVKVGGAYISCGSGKWLYLRNGQPFEGGDMWCSKTPLAP
jgi:hypothetical protein